MARPSKSHQFAIYHDSGIPTPDSTYKTSFDDAIEEQPESQSTQNQDGSEPEECHDGEDADDERRQSNVTKTSVSSMPEERWETDNECMTGPYHTPIIRPSFRRPESVRRMQLGSPPPFGQHSRRQSALNGRHLRGKPGTPRSARSAKETGSPISRHKEATEHEEQKMYPLVLLHITLLPTALPWSSDSIRNLLPQHVLDRIQLLRSKMTDLVIQRGLLIPHPRDEYDLLEERLLEALDLRQERIDKDGHFHRPRESTSSASTDGGSDSALGSSVETLSDTDYCSTCRSHLQRPKIRANSRWTIKIYAANGLMRAPAWSAAWTEMESVDVEISPLIAEEDRKKLDARRDDEELVAHLRRKEDEDRIRAAVDEQMRADHFEVSRAEETSRLLLEYELPSTAGKPQASQPAPHAKPANARPAPIGDDLPRIYRPSEVPLSVLMRNYLTLLAQDRKNVLVFTFAVLLILLGLRLVASPASPGLEKSTSTNGTDQLEPLATAVTLASHPLASSVGQSIESMNATSPETPITQNASMEGELFGARAVGEDSGEKALLRADAGESIESNVDDDKPNLVSEDERVENGFVDDGTEHIKTPLKDIAFSSHTDNEKGEAARVNGVVGDPEIGP